MQINQKEFSVMSTKDSKSRYVYFVKRVADSEKSYLLDKEGYALSSDAPGNTFLPLWPASVYAKACISGEWSDFSVKEVGINYLIDELLPKLAEDGIKIGVFMVPSIADTAVVTANELLNDLIAECAKYE